MTVMLSPVIGSGSAGYPVHGGFREGLMTVIPLHVGKGDNNIVE
jgi:hypothetical protein